MSDDLAELAEAARHRGLRLRRSRVRTPGKGDYGKAGLVDAQGRPVFGIEGGRLTASPDAVADFLRGQLQSGWAASLGSAAAQGGRTDRKPKPRPEPAPRSPMPEPEPVIRDARPADAPAIVALAAQLDHRVDAAGVRRRMVEMARAGDALIVATLGKEVVGLCGLHRMTVVHRDRPVGRITILIVAERARGKGLGRRLVSEAEARLRAAGCGLIEVTSNDRLRRAHAFYRHLGYQRTSMRFVRPLDEGSAAFMARP